MSVRPTRRPVAGRDVAMLQRTFWCKNRIKLPPSANLQRRRQGRWIKSGSANCRIFHMFRLQIVLCIGALQLQHHAFLF